MTTATASSTYIAGTWEIDPSHSDASFIVRHMMVSKVRGNFTSFSGKIVTAENPLESRASATIDMSSITTGNEQRDDHIRSADFFEVEKYPTMTYNSTAIRANGDEYVVEGELTLHGVTRAVELAVEVNGFGPDSFGGTRAGFSATGELNRRDFGIDISMPLDGGGVVVGDKIQLVLEIEAVLTPAE